MKWKKDNKMPNTKNVRKKNPDGSLAPPVKKPKRVQTKAKQSQLTIQNEVSWESFD